MQGWPRPASSAFGMAITLRFRPKPARLQATTEITRENGPMTSLIEMSEREYFANVGQRPGTFVGRTSFHALTAFLTGYDQNSARHGAPGLTGWREWLVARRGQDCNHAWPGQVLHIALPDGWDNPWNLPPEKEARAIEVLFQLLDEFLAERENNEAAHTTWRWTSLMEALANSP